MGSGEAVGHSTAPTLQKHNELVLKFCTVFVTVVSYGYVFYRGLANFAEIPIILIPIFHPFFAYSTVISGTQDKSVKFDRGVLIV